MKKKHNHRTLLLMILTFAIPFAIAWLAYHHINFVPSTKSNLGKLIIPVIPTQKLNIITMRGTPINSTTLNGKWLILILYPGQCDQHCNEKLYYSKQIQTATGKNQDRIGRAILRYKRDQKHFDTTLGKTSDDIQQLYVSKRQLERLLKRQNKPKKGAVFLVDPQGNLMMSYGPKSNPTDIYNDINKLLRVSQIG